MRKKDLLAKLIFNAMNPIGWWLKPQGRHKLFVLAYHRIGEIIPHYPFNRTILSATPEEFDRQLKYVKNHFRVIDFRQLDRLLADGGDITENTLVITFDDGYRDNLTTAAPILKSHDLTAVFYVTTDNISNGELMWFDLLHYYIRQLAPGQYPMGSDNYIFRRSGADDEDFSAMGQHMKDVPDSERLLLLEQLRQLTAASDPDQKRAMAEVLSWQDVRGLAAMGFEIGSHSCTHPHFSRLTQEQQLRQLRESKARIEQETGNEVVSFSYPTGLFDGTTLECVKAAGYRFAVAYDQDVWNLGGDRFTIPRIHVEPDVFMESFKGRLVLPDLFLDKAQPLSG